MEYNLRSAGINSKSTKQKLFKRTHTKFSPLPSAFITTRVMRANRKTLDVKFYQQIFAQSNYTSATKIQNYGIFIFNPC
jgi:hypothetical protein